MGAEEIIYNYGDEVTKNGTLSKFIGGVKKIETYIETKAGVKT